MHRTGENTVARRTAARALVDQLVIQKVGHVFCVPGESYLPVLDALLDAPIAVTVCRQEGGMAMMAEAHGKATGRPGICFVTRGPGATNAAAGVHVAYQDSTPLLLFVGQVQRPFSGRDAWQELDYGRVFGGLAKWATQIEDPDRITEIVARAFHVALSGRPGPVVIGLPADMLSLPTRSHDAPLIVAPETHPAPEDMARLRDLLDGAKRPFLILGGTRWTAEARAYVQAFAERFSLPVATSHRRSGLFDADHPCYAGELGLSPNPKLLERIKGADLLVLLGGRLGDVPSQGYALLDIPVPQAPLAHIYPDAEELGRVYQPHLAINASPQAFARALQTLSPKSEPSGGSSNHGADLAAAREDYLAWSQTATPQPGGVNLGEVVIMLRTLLPPDAILTNGAGNFAGFINRFHRVRALDAHIAPTSGSMGYGLPAAVAMKRLYPERTVVAITGDGDFLMTGQEFATAVQYGLAIVVILADNASYGTIRMHQERAFPGRVAATDLVNPDFAAYARAFGGFGALVERTQDFPAALAEAMATNRPAILHLKIATDAISPGTTLAEVREAALKREAAKPG